MADSDIKADVSLSIISNTVLTTVASTESSFSPAKNTNNWKQNKNKKNKKQKFLQFLNSVIKCTSALKKIIPIFSSANLFNQFQVSD